MLWILSILLRPIAHRSTRKPLVKAVPTRTLLPPRAPVHQPYIAEVPSLPPGYRPQAAHDADEQRIRAGLLALLGEAL
ncbi:hypothetical protein ACWGCW_31545 [Streptomyces sp. NPDC054933]